MGSKAGWEINLGGFGSLLTLKTTITLWLLLVALSLFLFHSLSWKGDKWFWEEFAHPGQSSRWMVVSREKARTELFAAGQNQWSHGESLVSNSPLFPRFGSQSHPYCSNCPMLFDEITVYTPSLAAWVRICRVVMPVVCGSRHPRCWEL